MPCISASPLYFGAHAGGRRAALASRPPANCANFALRGAAPPRMGWGGGKTPSPLATTFTCATASLRQRGTCYDAAAPAAFLCASSRRLTFPHRRIGRAARFCLCRNGSGWLLGNAGNGRAAIIPFMVCARTCCAPRTRISRENSSLCAAARGGRIRWRGTAGRNAYSINIASGAAGFRRAGVPSLSLFLVCVAPAYLRFLWPACGRCRHAGIYCMHTCSACMHLPYPARMLPASSPSCHRPYTAFLLLLGIPASPYLLKTVPISSR